MIIVAFVVFAEVFVVALLVLQHRERDAWARERHSLLNRIQHPQILQSASRETPEAPPEPVPDVLAMVGGVYEDPED